MISVDAAKNIIKQHCCLLAPVQKSLQKAGGLVLAEDVYAKVSVPNFNQSAVDGYAFRFTDYRQTKQLNIVGEVAAGDDANIKVTTNEAVRIFTGAALPHDTDTIVMQEKTVLVDGKLIINDEDLKKWNHVRMQGAEITINAVALPAGIVLTPAAIGFLSGVGTTEVQVYPKPVVHIVITGKELKKPGTALRYGQVYESNSVMLQAALEQLHITDVTITFANDDVSEIQSGITNGLLNADIVLLSGGVSVGNYDFVVQAAEASGVQQLFHKVKQRPGKPLYAGTKNNKIVFGLPGNPSSVLSCFYNYVVTAIEELTGLSNIIEKKYLPLAVAYDKKTNLTHFIKAIYNKEEVIPLNAQESFRLSSFSLANCLIVLPEEKTFFAKGEMVETFILP